MELRDAIDDLAGAVGGLRVELVALTDAIKAFRTDLGDHFQKLRGELHAQHTISRETVLVLKDIRSLLETEPTRRDLPRRVEALEALVAAGGG